MTTRELPSGLEQESRSLAFDQDSVPPALCREHALGPGRWGVLTVLAGEVTFFDVRSATERQLHAPDSIVIEPEAPHELRLHEGPLQCRVDFYRRP